MTQPGATPTKQTDIRSLSEWIASVEMHPDEYHRARELLDAALREQTRITVERIRGRVQNEPHSPNCEYGSDILDILDEVAAVPPAPGPGEEDEA